MLLWERRPTTPCCSAPQPPNINLINCAHRSHKKERTVHLIASTPTPPPLPPILSVAARRRLRFVVLPCVRPSPLTLPLFRFVVSLSPPPPSSSISRSLFPPHEMH